MPNISVCKISAPVTLATIQSFATLRLRSLQVNPEAFGSNYAREVAFTEEQWRERIEPNSDKATFIATATHMNLPEHSQDVATVTDEEQWIGSVSILGPDYLTKIPFTLPAAFEERDELWYMLVGTWVEPQFRGMGIGKRLMREALQWATGSRGASPPNEVQKKCVLLRVHAQNTAAQMLYRASGFERFEDPEDESAPSDEIWMGYRVQNGDNSSAINDAQE
ncbi:hypothetical protein FA15DRAFT_160376 [Coprinopsis marcescibilis]|uniref:N-acetyltransferase domain-containing protein n=1 Tax=Coprinopsis marcescibilis TaxID=230819 RepID=A0A5C3L4H6_COPMA|nr:hypothetical protein FA15DRAFT_160376 [Coprinopsis marcescibilis]